MKRTTPYLVWIGITFGFLALLLYIVIPQFPVWPMTFFILSALNLATFAILDRKNIRRAMNTRQAMYGMNAAVLILVFTGILIFLNILAHRHKARVDLTETGYYTLAPQTEKVLSGLNRPVKIMAFYQVDDPGKKEFVQLMDGFQQFSDQIEIEYIDPIQSPTLSNQYGLKTDRTVVLQSGPQQDKIENVTEESLLNGILSVTRDGQKKVYFIGGHGEKDIEDQDKAGFSKVREGLEKNNFKVASLFLLQTGSIPGDADLVVLPGPKKKLQEKELQALDAYLKRGGSVFLLLDPQYDAGLKDFLGRWGIALKDDIVVDPNSLNLAIPIVKRFVKHAITQDFTMPVIFPLVRSISPIETEGLTVTQLAFASDNSWSEVKYEGGNVEYDPGEDLKGNVPVAMVVTQPVLSAMESESDSTPPEKDSSRESRLVVVGDSDFVANTTFSTYGNSDFFLNTASWLMEEEELISIRPHERKYSPLTLTRPQRNLVLVTGMVVLPMLTAVLGVRIWWKRRSL
ncbi:GldG family protein [Nitrospina sp. 32_T5]|uniref:GldG family protein n=1 Tax=unclassified Nitrospina TaxID=2638683 RepID=UPI003F96699A